MKMVIVGPGAIGCLFAVRMQAAGETVTLLDKDEARATELTARGLRIEEPGSPEPACQTVHVPVQFDAQRLRTATGFPSFVVLCVKAYDTATAVRHALPLVGPKTALVSLQNGMGNVEEIQNVVGTDRILCAVTGHGATHVGIGTIRHAGSGITTVAAVSPGYDDQAAHFVDNLQRAGFEAHLLDDCKRMLWSKLIVNAAINPVTALHNIPNGDLLRRPELLETALAAAREADAVARAAGVRPRLDNPDEEIRRICERTRDNVSSMLQDVRRGRQTEIDSINGFIVRQANAYGIDVPVNQQLWKAVESRTQSQKRI